VAVAGVGFLIEELDAVDQQAVDCIVFSFSPGFFSLAFFWRNLLIDKSFNS
jgi:hypothetical protein